MTTSNRPAPPPASTAPGDATPRTIPYVFMTIWIGIGVVMLLPGMQPHFASYSDWINLYRTRHWAQHPLPYLRQSMEYPVLLGWTVWALTWVPGGETGFVLANGLLMWGCAVGVFWGLQRISPRHALWWAATPLLIVLATQNWDLWGILPFIAAWVTYERHRWAWAGVWLAVGTAVKLFPVVAWPFMVYALWKRGEVGAAARLTGTATVVWLATNVPTLLAAPAGWLWFWRVNAVRPLQGDLWTTLRVESLLTIPQWNAFTLALVLTAASVALWAMSRGLGPRAATATVLVVFLTLNKVWSPQYMLWIYAIACVAEWPPWTLALLTAAGLLDWVNAYLILLPLRLQHKLLPRFISWGTVYPWGVRLRYGVLVLAALGGWTQAGRPRSQGAEPESALATTRST